jgi:triosephosphate isomerase
MARMPLIAGNWKMYKTPAEAADLARSVVDGVRGVVGVEVLLCPPAVDLLAVGDVLGCGAVMLGAQNCHFETEGAYTGEVSAAMLKAAGCKYVIVGHSERRQYCGETDEVVNKKVKAALGAGLNVIMCLGETLVQREAGEGWKALIARQLAEGLAGVAAADMTRVVVAYEPVWAIGTGKTATPAQAGEAHAVLRVRLAELYGGEIAAATRILYGGSVKPDNVKTLMAEEHVDGALVGGASLKAETFVPLARFKE